LERVLDKGIVIAGDIQIRLLDIEQLGDLNRRLEALEGRVAESPQVESTYGGREGTRRGQR
jgi:hypothetical protein